SDKISDSDPHSIGKPPNPIKAISEEARKTAEILNKYLVRSREILAYHPFNERRKIQGKLPANELLLRGPGLTPNLMPFQEMYGISGAYAVGIPMIRGLANLMGLEELKIRGITGSIDTDYDAKIRGAVNALSKKDFVLVNIKAPDVAAHDKNPILKREVLEKIDVAMKPLTEILEETVVILTGDHSTSSESGEHTGDPVPFLISSYDIRTNGCQRFDEKNCGIATFRIQSRNVMQYGMQLADRSEKYGA
ncbi:cofactor-independent phosphoglycerate mutase, partial [mine drainage metagenome]